MQCVCVCGGGGGCECVWTLKSDILPPPASPLDHIHTCGSVSVSGDEEIKQCGPSMCVCRGGAHPILLYFHHILLIFSRHT